FAIDPHSVPQSKATNDLGSDENILRCLNKIAFRVAKKTETFSGNLNDALAELWFALDLVATFRSAFHGFGAHGISTALAGHVVPGFVVVVVKIIVTAAIVVTAPAITAAAARTTLVGRSGRRFSFQRRLVLVFLVHKLQRRIARRSGRTAGIRFENYFFRLATWPASRREYLDSNRRFERHRLLPRHHTNGAPAGPRPRWPPGQCYRG